LLSGVNNKNIDIMKLVELVRYFRQGNSFEEFCRENSLDLKSEVIEIYIADSLNIGNDIACFEIEKTEGKIEYSSNGIDYFYLFDFYYFQDAINESNAGSYLSLPDEQIAKILYNYAVNDA
jgi:hypothetical protein